MTLELVEPDAQGRISGGYLYNQQLSDASERLRKHSIPAHSLREFAACMPLSEGSVLLIDSLFLDRDSIQHLSALRAQTHVPFGVVLHSFPSFLERAQDSVQVFADSPWLPSALERELLQELDFIVAPGPYIPQTLAQINCRIPVVTCVPGCPPVEPPRLGRQLPCQGPLNIVTVGSVSQNKGHLDALDAVNGCKDIELTWTIIGALTTDASYSRLLQEAIHTAGLSERVKLCPAVPHREVLKRLDQAHLCLLPSYTENQPLAVMEAIYLGVPVVGYAVGGMPDLVQTSGAGALAALGDRTELRQHLSRMLTDRELYAETSTRCLSVSQLWPSWQQTGESLVGAVEQITGRTLARR